LPITVDSFDLFANNLGINRTLHIVHIGHGCGNGHCPNSVREKLQKMMRFGACFNACQTFAHLPGRININCSIWPRPWWSVYLSINQYIQIYRVSYLVIDWHREDSALLW